MAFAQVNGQRLYYEDTGGDGPPIVFSHGFLTDHEAFGAQVAELRDRWRVITFDGRAWGDSGSDGRPFTWWDLAGDVLGLLDHLQIERAVLGGLAQGGAVCLRAGLMSPDRVRALVLIATRAGVDPGHTHTGFRGLLDRWLERGYADDLARPLAAFLLGDEDDAGTWREKWRRWPQERLATARDCLLAGDDVTERLEEIEAPALVLRGATDPLVAPRDAETLCAGLYDCRGVVSIDGAAHAPNVTRPTAVNETIRRFLEGLPA